MDITGESRPTTEGADSGSSIPENGAAKGRGPRSARLDDISDKDDLLRFAAKAQILRLKERGIAQNKVAMALGIPEGTLSDTLSGSGNNALPIIKILPGLDAVVFAFDSKLTTTTGGLVALADRLRGYKDEATAVGKVSPGWVDELMAKSFTTPVGFLLQATALLSAFNGVSSQAASDAVCEHHSKDLAKVFYPLLMMGVGAPTAHSIDALILLGGLARHEAAFKQISDVLEEVLVESPLGFRLWRVITSIVLAAAVGEGSVNLDGERRDRRRKRQTDLTTEHLKKWVRSRLPRSQEWRATSLYPARSLDLELAIAIPFAWTKDGPDWAAELLMNRAMNPQATLRERCTAAMGVWERGYTSADEPGSGRHKRQLHLIIEKLEAERAEQLAELRKYDSAPPDGLDWLIDTLKDLEKQDVRVLSALPTGEHPCREAVAAGVRVLNGDTSIPPLLRRATEFLFCQAVLQNAGVYRRKAIDTLRGAGLAEQAATAMTAVLKDHHSKPWLRCRVLFAIGFLQHRESDVEDALKQAFIHARDELNNAKAELTRDIVSEVHDVIFAIGDCYGAQGQEGAARRIRRDLADQRLWTLVDSCTDEHLFPISRAAAYLLTVTPQPEDKERLEQLARTHPDRTTRDACDWALRTRFVGDEIRPLSLAAPPR